ncbi:GHKL domain-containing protein [Bifidobacterium ramosum]|nr:GHKL domain-containing protein [Bifidobacterium ramosum]
MPALASATQFFTANGMVFELLVSTLMFTWWLDRRPGFAMRAPAGMAAILVCSMAWNLLVPADLWTATVQNVAVYLVFTLWILVCWRVNIRQAVFYFVMGGTLQHFVYRGARLSSIWLHAFWHDGAWIDTYVYALMQIPFLLLGYWWFARPLVRKPTSALAGRSVIGMLFGMLLCISVFTNLFNATAAPGGSQAFTIFSAFDLVTCVFLMTLAVEVVVNQAVRSDAEVMRELLRQQRRQLAASKETIDLINVKTHDLKKQIATLGPRISPEQASELSDLVDLYDASVRTGNESLDVLLAQKSMQCEQRGIRFDRMIDGRLLSFMTPVDIYSLFGNAIDNALEAVDRLDDDADRYVAVRVREEKGMVMIRVENPYAGELSFDDGLPRTTKDDARYHGFGTRSIRMIAERYDGTMSIVARGGVFRLTVILPR